MVAAIRWEPSSATDSNWTASLASARSVVGSAAHAAATVSSRAAQPQQRGRPLMLRDSRGRVRAEDGVFGEVAGRARIWTSRHGVEQRLQAVSVAELIRWTSGAVGPDAQSRMA